MVSRFIGTIENCSDAPPWRKSTLCDAGTLPSVAEVGFGLRQDVSKVFERWLISRTDMPTPGSDDEIALRFFETGSGRTAGPAEKLWMR